MKHLIMIGALILASLSALGADQLYIRNRPFKGAVTQSGGKIWVELKSAAQAFQAPLLENGQGGYAISETPLTPEELAGLAANQLRLGETVVDLQQVNGLHFVELDTLARLMNARVIVNKQLQTIDVSLATPAQAAAASSGPESQVPPPANVLRIQGKITLEGANQVGLFEGGSASTPYKTGTVDAKGNYSIDIDLSKDLHPNGGVSMTDMRFFREGAFDQCHGRCNFIVRQGKKLELQVYQGPTYPISGNTFQYTESR